MFGVLYDLLFIWTLVRLHACTSAVEFLLQLVNDVQALVEGFCRPTSGVALQILVVEAAHLSLLAHHRAHFRI